MPPEPVQGLSGSPGSGLKKPRAPGAQGQRVTEGRDAKPHPRQTAQSPQATALPQQRTVTSKAAEGGRGCHSSTRESNAPSPAWPHWREGLPAEVKHKYQPRIQEWGLAEARVRVHWAVGGEIAQRVHLQEA